MGYSIKTNNFTGIIKDVSSCIDYTKFDRNSVKLIRDLENMY